MCASGNTGRITTGYSPVPYPVQFMYKLPPEIPGVNLTLFMMTYVYILQIGKFG